MLGVGVQHRHPYLAAIASIHRSRTVDDRDAVFRREATARHNETDVPVGKSDRDSRANRCASAGSELDRLGSAQVCARVSRMRVCGHVRARNEYIHVVGHVTRVVQNPVPLESLIE
jgi:hypothetical protein